MQGLTPFGMLLTGKQPGLTEHAQRMMREAATLLGASGGAVLCKYRSAAENHPECAPLMLYMWVETNAVAEVEDRQCGPQDGDFCRCRKASSSYCLVSPE